jgi:ATP-dependent Clp protease ATP-binding subunit ClpB
VIFNPLDKEAITKIVDILFRDIQNKLKERDIKVTLTQAAKEYIAEAGFDPVYGARPLKRALYSVVEDRLAELILQDRVKEGSSVEFDVKDGEVIVNIS